MSSLVLDISRTDMQGCYHNLYLRYAWVGEHHARALHPLPTRLIDGSGLTFNTVHGLPPDS
jgi:hypothetical protein